MRTTRALLPPTLVVVFAAACADGPPVVVEDYGEGPNVTVELLDDAWVRFEGERRPIEYFLLQMRWRCREIEDLAERPTVDVRVAPGAPPVRPAVWSRFTTELQKAGVRHIRWGGGDGA